MFAANAKLWCAWAIGICLITLVAGASLIIFADIGGPRWAFVAIGLWLWTVGLPTTLAVLLAASMWGTVPGMTTDTLGPFLLFAAALGLAAQIISFLLVRAAIRSRAKRRLRV